MIQGVFLPLAIFALSASSTVLYGRDINAPILKAYDYIIVGCGISGLVVSNRLSEDNSVTVLCIEAGEADQYESIIQDPVYVGADIGGIYDWDLETVPQLQLDGGARPMPQGKVLGGGSILNAMCWNRGGQDDYNAWEGLGNPGWGWDGMLPYFMKSETYTPVYSEEIAEEYSIHYNPAVHGFSGPVQVSYPKYFYPQSVNLFTALNYLGIPTEFDQAEGNSAGAAFIPTDLDPNNQTRSDARRTYFDPFTNRQNFHVITGQHVTSVLIDGVSSDQEANVPTFGSNNNGDGSAAGDTGGLGFGPGPTIPPAEGETSHRLARRDPSSASLRILGVEFATEASAPRQTVYATREVIVAAGSLHSAQLLQLSGIGAAPLLEQFGITVALDLPGVGNNLQDHCLVGTFYPYNNVSYPSPTDLTTNATYNAEAEAEYNSDKTGPWTAGSPNAVAFPPLTLITDNFASMLSDANDQQAAEFLAPGLDATVVSGFGAQKATVVDILDSEHNAAYEIINNNAGSLTVSVMHPLSRGTCYINSPDPFEPPLIDPRWLSNPLDRQVLIEALLFNREILAAPSMAELLPAQFVPPIDANEDALNQIINNGIRTEFHPSGTCAMLPLEQGGVVDSHLRVYGTQNLRVVDAGIFPLIPASHLQAVVYAVAEKAADIIKADNVGVQPSQVPTSSSSINATAVSNNTAALATNVPFSNVSSFLNSSFSPSVATVVGPTDTSIAVSITSVSVRTSDLVSSTIAISSNDGTTTLFSPIIPATSIARDTAPSPSTAAVTSSVREFSEYTSTPLTTLSAGDTIFSSATSLAASSLADSLPLDSTTSLTIPASSDATTNADQDTETSMAGTLSQTVQETSTSAVVISEANLPSSTNANSPSTSLSAADQQFLTSQHTFEPTSTPSPIPGGFSIDIPNLSSSIVAILTSDGLSPQVASSLEPIILGTLSAIEQTSAAATPTSRSSESQDNPQLEAAITSFVDWLLAFFHLD